jgi:hypothetical protein
MKFIMEEITAMDLSMLSTTLKRELLSELV